MRKINKILLLALLALALLICTAGTSNAVDQVLIQTGFSNDDVTEPNLWDIMNLMTETGAPTITETWVNENQTGQLFWSGDKAVVTAYSNYADTFEDFRWGNGLVEGELLIADTDGTFLDLNIPFDPVFNPFHPEWFFINWSDNGNVISAYAWPDNLATFEFDDYYIIAFEDWDLDATDPVSDRDYQDLVVKFHIVPEPVSSILFIIGAAAFGLRGLRKKRA